MARSVISRLGRQSNAGRSRTASPCIVGEPFWTVVALGSHPRERERVRDSCLHQPTKTGGGRGVCWGWLPPSELPLTRRTSRPVPLDHDHHTRPAATDARAPLALAMGWALVGLPTCGPIRPPALLARLLRTSLPPAQQTGPRYMGSPPPLHCSAAPAARRLSFDPARRGGSLLLLRACAGRRPPPPPPPPSRHGSTVQEL
jgi:hypothetical protein